MGLQYLALRALVECLVRRPFYHKPKQSFHKPSGFLASSSGPIGSLEAFPVEILHTICNSLDFQSLSRFSRVCGQAKGLVESLPAYQRLMEHASELLILLSHMRFLSFHTAAMIYAALLSDQCVCCQKFAPFLFLPTCQRCCYGCLYGEWSLQVTEYSMAQFCFGLSQKELDQLPSMLSIPGSYPVGCDGVNHREQFRLVSVKEAHALGISVHGSQEAMESVGVSREPPPAFYGQPHQPHDLRHAQWIAHTTPASKLKDQFCGMGSIPFPSLKPDGTLRDVLWCPGCRFICDNNGILPAPVYPRPLYPSRLRELMNTENEFLGHLTDCKEAKEFLQESTEIVVGGRTGIRRAARNLPLS